MHAPLFKWSQTFEALLEDDTCHLAKFFTYSLSDLWLLLCDKVKVYCVGCKVSGMQ